MGSTQGSLHILCDLFRSLLIVLIALPSLSTSSCTHRTRYTLKECHPVPDGWTSVRRPPPNHEIQLQIGLRQSRFHELEQHLNEGKLVALWTCDFIKRSLVDLPFVNPVSNPSHTRYGQYLTAQEVNDLITPSNDTLFLVEQWLLEHGITIDEMRYSPALDWITLDLPIGVVDELLQTKYTEFWHEESKTSAIRAPEWMLPKHLHDHIESIQPTSSFLYALASKADLSPINFPRSPNTKTRDVSDGSEVKDLNQLAEDFSDDQPQLLDLDNLPDDLAVSQACNGSAVTPLCVRVLYGTLGYKAQASDRNAMALVNYDGEFNNRSDIHLFLEAYRPEAARAGAAFDFLTDDIAGATNQQSPATPSQLEEKIGREGNMDAQILLGIAFPTPLITYSVGGQAPSFRPDKYTPTNTNEPFLTWLHHILAQENLPQVIATSYGDIEQTVPYAYAKRVCEDFAQLGARGVSVIFGAGDSGVGKPGYCQSNNGSEAYEFLTSFPASCPYGTSVGATRLSSNPNEEGEEIVAYNNLNGFVSGGGFSKYFPRPSYQNSHGVIDTYLSRHVGDDTYAGLFNRGGRAYPDVAAQGYRRVIVWSGHRFIVDGTSASAPTFAAVVALVNDALLAEGKPPLGFLNPWLYQTGFEAFTDVTTGGNDGCGTPGFRASKGWDPASGFGTPVSTRARINLLPSVWHARTCFRWTGLLSADDLHHSGFRA